MKKLNVRIMAEIAIFAALGYVVNYLCDLLTSVTPLGIIWFNGGSITIAYVMIIIISFRRGIVSGIITGVLMMLLSFMNGIYVISSSWYNVIAQIALDYLIPWPIVGLCAIFKKKYDSLDNKKSTIFLVLGALLGGFLKFLSHFFAGILFWGVYAPEGQHAAFYSFWYNGSQIFLSVLLSIILLVIINLKYRHFITDKK